MVSRLCRVLLLVSVILTFSACSATPTRRSFKEGAKDTTIAAKVNFKLTKDSIVKKRNFNVDVWRGVVTLTGRVTSPEEKERTEQLVLQVKGVRGVDNFLRIVDDYKTGGEVVAKKEQRKEETGLSPEAPQKTEKSPKVAAKVPAAVAKPKAEPVKEAPTPVDNKVVQKVKTPQVNSQEGVEDESRQMSATRSRFDKPNSAQIGKEDLTSEEALANEAAAELKKLRGEEDLE